MNPIYNNYTNIIGNTDIHHAPSGLRAPKLRTCIHRVVELEQNMSNDILSMKKNSTMIFNNNIIEFDQNLSCSNPGKYMINPASS